MPSFNKERRTRMEQDRQDNAIEDTRRTITASEAVALNQAASSSSDDDTEYVEEQSGTTGNRPENPYESEYFFDMTLHLPIWYNGTDWVNAVGTVV